MVKLKCTVKTYCNFLMHYIIWWKITSVSILCHNNKFSLRSLFLDSWGGPLYHAQSFKTSERNLKKEQGRKTVKKFKKSKTRTVCTQPTYATKKIKNRVTLIHHHFYFIFYFNINANIQTFTDSEHKTWIKLCTADELINKWTKPTSAVLAFLFIW